VARPDFRDQAVALESAKLHAPRANVAKLTELLELTAGTGTFPVEGNPEQTEERTVFRPYYAAARWLRQNFNHIVKSTGVVGAQKVDPAEAIADLIDMQAAEDARLSLIVPAGYVATPQTLPSVETASPIFAGVVR